jgi:hypothetical protein
MQVYEKPRICANAYLQSLDGEGDVSAAQALHGTDGSIARASLPARRREESDRAVEDGATVDYGLDSQVRYWSDYLKARLHPRSCRAISGVHFGVNDFSMFGSGTVAASSNALDDAYDDLRHFVEDCDQLGALVFHCDVHSGFSGYASRYMSHLRDELGESLSMCLFGAASRTPGHATSENQSLRTELTQRSLNEALVLSACIEQSNQYVPLRADATRNFRFVHPDLGHPFQTSAVLGTAVDVLLSSLQHSRSNLSPAGLFSALRPAPFARLSSLAAALPIVRDVAFQRAAISELDDVVKLSKASPGDRHASNHSNLPSDGVPHHLPARELVCGRGISGVAPLFCDIPLRIAVPIPYPRFFDRRIDLTGKMLPPAIASKRPRLGEVGEMSCLVSAYVDGPEESAALAGFGSRLHEAARDVPSLRGMLEAETVLEYAEGVAALAADYRTI